MSNVHHTIKINVPGLLRIEQICFAVPIWSPTHSDMIDFIYSLGKGMP